MMKYAAALLPEGMAPSMMPRPVDRGRSARYAKMVGHLSLSPSSRSATASLRLGQYFPLCLFHNAALQRLRRVTGQHFHRALGDDLPPSGIS